MDRDRKRWEKTIALDFDNVIHDYKGELTPACTGPPVPGAIEGMKALLERGFFLVVFTAREELGPIVQWLAKYGLYVDLETLVVTNHKPKALVYVDDRAIRFTDWADLCLYFY